VETEIFSFIILDIQNWVYISKETENSDPPQYLRSLGPVFLKPVSPLHRLQVKEMIFFPKPKTFGGRLTAPDSDYDYMPVQVFI